MDVWSTHCDLSTRYLLNNLDWLDDALGAYEDDYLIIDCPGEDSLPTVQLNEDMTWLIVHSPKYAGQIELYTHIPLLPRLVNHLSTSSLGFRCSAVYLLESQFMQADKAKFFAGVLSAMSCMLQMGCGMLCVMSKMDLVRKAASSGGGKGKKGKGKMRVGKEVAR
jgi:hypothetical protein